MSSHDRQADLGWIETPFLGRLEFDSPDAKKIELALLKRVAGKIDKGLATTLAARAELPTEGLRELVRFLVSMLTTHFFPDGHGRLDSDGDRLRAPAVGKIVFKRWPRFEHRVLLSLSAQPPGERNGVHFRKHFSSIVLFAHALDGMTDPRAAGEALHEMAHMTRWMILRLKKSVGDTEAQVMLRDAPWRLFDLSGFTSLGERMEKLVPPLLKVLPVTDPPSSVAASLIEESLPYVLGAIVDEAIARDVHKRSGVKGPAVLPTFDFSPTELVRSYVLHRHNITRKQLTTAAATSALAQLEDVVRELGTAMRAHLEQ